MVSGPARRRSAGVPGLRPYGPVRCRSPRWSPPGVAATRPAAGPGWLRTRGNAPAGAAPRSGLNRGRGRVGGGHIPMAPGCCRTRGGGSASSRRPGPPRPTRGCRRGSSSATAGMRHHCRLSHPRYGRGQIVLVADGLESLRRKRIAFTSHRHRDERPDIGQPPFLGISWSWSPCRRTLTRVLVLTLSDAQILRRGHPERRSTPCRAAVTDRR